MFSICFLSASRSIAESTLGSMTPPPPAPAYVVAAAAAAVAYTRTYMYIRWRYTAVIVADAAAAVDQRRLSVRRGLRKTHACAHTHTRARTHDSYNISKRTPTRAYTRTNLHANTLKNIHAYTLTRVHTDTHVHVYTHAQTVARALRHRRKRAPSAPAAASPAPRHHWHGRQRFSRPLLPATAAHTRHDIDYYRRTKTRARQQRVPRCAGGGGGGSTLRPPAPRRPAFATLNRRFYFCTYIPVAYTLNLLHVYL